MVNALLRSSLREIRQSLGRYLAILAIIALGVGFFAGLRMCEPNMKATGQKYLADTQLFDIRLISTLGFTEEDAAWFAELEGVKTARGSVYKAFLSSIEGQSDYLLCAHSLTGGINEPSLLAGRLPQAANECLGDAMYFSEADIGKSIRVSQANDEDTLELLAYDEYILTGIANSPLYLNFERGTASVGDGSVDAFVLIPEDGFTFEAYYELYLTLEDADRAYTEAYDNFIDALKPELERLTQERADLRYQTLRNDALDELLDAEEELADGWKEYYDGVADFEQGKLDYADGLEEYRDGVQELADAEIELADGWKEYYDGVADFEQGKLDYADGLEEYRDGVRELADAEAELADGWKKYYDGAAEYEDGVAKYEDGLAEYNDGAAELADAREKLDDGWREYEAGKIQAQEQLDSARQQLLDAEAAYEAGLAEYEDGMRQLQEAKHELDENQALMDAAKAELDAGRTELEEAERKLAEGEAGYAQASALYASGQALASAFCVDSAEALFAMADASPEFAAQLDGILTAQGSSLTEFRGGWNAAAAAMGGALNEASLAAVRASLDEGAQELAAGQAEYESGLAEYEDGKAQLDAGWQEYNAGVAELSAARAELDKAPAQIESGWREYQEGKAQAEAELENAYAELTDAENAYAEGERELLEGKQELDDAEKELQDAKAELDDALQELTDGQRELDEGKAKLDDARLELDDAAAKLRDAEAELADAKIELTDGEQELADGKQELTDAQTELSDAKTELADAEIELADALTELSDGEQEIADAYKDLEELEEADTFVLTRSENVGYVSFANNINIIKAISVVFPVFFFLVAALVCMTTMTRMVDEQRAQIGVLKAMGYANAQILGKFILYSGTAALIGSVFGYTVGVFSLPWVIWEIYGIMYDFAPLIYNFDPVLALISFAAAMLCSVGVTWLSCRIELSIPAAALIRPKTPKAGKRVFLEWITPVWKRLSFLQKVSVRNVLRYRSRLIMMLLGIGGCTALLITGFGLRDSVVSIADVQYNDITLYDYSVTFNDTIDRDEADRYLTQRGWMPQEGLLVSSLNADLLWKEDSASVSLVIPADTNVEGFVNLTQDEKQLDFPQKGQALISIGAATNLGIGTGDVVEVRDDELRTIRVTVAGICDNYMGDMVWISQETWLEQHRELPECKTLWLQGHDRNDPKAESVILADDEAVVSVGINAVSRDQIGSLLGRMDYVVIVVVICAAALAFIVMYNLTNINISERIREIATIKVLGFYRAETASYVFREIYILSVLGSLVGLVLGKLLHKFVMAQVRLDGIYFPQEISIVSYAVSVVLTLVFTVLITLFMRRRLADIDMAESLKSVE